MKNATLITLCSLILFMTACGQVGNEDFYYENTHEAYHQGSSAPEQGQTSSGNSMKSGVSMRPVIDAKTGRPTFYLPLPNTWELTQKAWLGPNKTKVVYLNGQMTYPQQGGYSSIDQLIRQTFEPSFRQQNTRITKMYDLPKIARQKEAYFSHLWKAAPSRERFEVKGIELMDQNGERGLVILHFWTSVSQYTNYSAYDYYFMEAAADDFEQSKQELIYALANVQWDRQHIASYNNREQMKSQQSWAAHNQKMAQRQSTFNSFQQTQNTLNEVSDIYHNTWKNTNAMNNAGHQKTINGIYNQNTMVNPHNGQNVQVSHGYNQYYMNSNNEWIGTNDAFYNPQNDPNVNHQNWEQMDYYDSNY